MRKYIFSKNTLHKIFLYTSTLIIICSCAGTINTVKYSNPINIDYKKAYIISAENSQYIQFKFGVITPYAYIPLPDDPAQKHEVIGNTDIVIKRELEKYGITAEIGKKGDRPENFDLIVEYHDTWRWDFKKVLDRLDIIFIAPTGDSIIAKSTYNISRNKEFHNFPSPEKEVPKMIKELLNK